MSNLTYFWLPFSLGWLFILTIFYTYPLALTVHSLSFFRISMASGIFLVCFYHREAPYSSIFVHLFQSGVFLRLLGHWNSQCSSITGEVTRNLSQKWEQDGDTSVLPNFATCDRHIHLRFRSGMKNGQ